MNGIQRVRARRPSRGRFGRGVEDGEVAPAARQVVVNGKTGLAASDDAIIYFAATVTSGNGFATGLAGEVSCAVLVPETPSPARSKTTAIRCSFIFDLFPVGCVDFQRRLAPLPASIRFATRPRRSYLQMFGPLLPALPADGKPSV